MAVPKAITNHTAPGLPTFTADPAIPQPSTPFTLNWTIPGFKQQSFTTVKIDCVPNYSTGPNLPDGGQDVTAKNSVDGSGNASGSFQATVVKPEEYIFTLSAAGAGVTVSKKLSFTAGGIATIFFGLNGQSFSFTTPQWNNFYTVTLASARAAFDAHITGMGNWRDTLNQLNGIDASTTDASGPIATLKRLGKAVVGSTIMAFAANTILEPNFAYNTTKENVYAALTKMDGLQSNAQGACDSLTAAQTAMNDGIARMQAYDNAIQDGGERAIVAIGVVKDAAIIALSCTPAGLGASVLQAAVIAATETAAEKATTRLLEWQTYTPQKFASDAADVFISFVSAFVGGKAADGASELGDKISEHLTQDIMTKVGNNQLKAIVSNVVTDYCNNLGNTLKAAVVNYQKEDDWTQFIMNLKWDAIVGALPPEVRKDKS